MWVGQPAFQEASPPPDIHTHVAADSWYVAKQVWQAVRLLTREKLRQD